MTEIQRIENIVRSLKALLPDCGEVYISKSELEGITLGLGSNIYNHKPHAYFIYVENCNIAKSFWSLDEMENWLVRQIHGLKLLTVTIPSSDARRKKIAQRYMVGQFNKEELN